VRRRVGLITFVGRRDCLVVAHRASPSTVNDGIGTAQLLFLPRPEGFARASRPKRVRRMRHCASVAKF
jgi:hypothetical protein